LRNQIVSNSYSLNFVHALSVRNVKKYNDYDYGNLYFCGAANCHPIKVHIFDKKKEDQVIDWKIDRNQNHQYFSMRGIAFPDQVEDILEKLLVSHWSKKQGKSLVKPEEEVASDGELSPVELNQSLGTPNTEINVKARKSLNFE
jgi:hypothetical protein